MMMDHLDDPLGTSLLGRDGGDGGGHEDPLDALLRPASPPTPSPARSAGASATRPLDPAGPAGAGRQRPGGGLAHELSSLPTRSAAALYAVLRPSRGRGVLNVLAVLPLCARRADFATHFSAAVREIFAACSVPLVSVPVGRYEVVDVPSLVGALRSTAAGSETKKDALHFAHEWNCSR